jgi:hypothetical protein
MKILQGVSTAELNNARKVLQKDTLAEAVNARTAAQVAKRLNNAILDFYLVAEDKKLDELAKFYKGHDMHDVLVEAIADFRKAAAVLVGKNNPDSPAKFIAHFLENDGDL